MFCEKRWKKHNLKILGTKLLVDVFLKQHIIPM